MKLGRFASGAFSTLALLAVVVLATYMYRGNPFDPIDRGKSVATDEYVGQTKASIVAQYGQPTCQWAGHYGQPPEDYVKQHDPAVSCTYTRATGALYISFEQKGGQWVCFSSHWVPNGIALD
jgi:hypothetical protein